MSAVFALKNIGVRAHSDKKETARALNITDQ